jgi:DNA-binding NtrC family response regulator
VISDNEVIAFANPNSISISTTRSKNEKSSNFDDFNNFQEYKDYAERNFIKYKLEKNNWNVSKTADDIDIQRSHLYSKIEKYSLKREE